MLLLVGRYSDQGVNRGEMSSQGFIPGLLLALLAELLMSRDRVPRGCLQGPEDSRKPPREPAGPLSLLLVHPRHHAPHALAGPLDLLALFCFPPGEELVGNLEQECGGDHPSDHRRGAAVELDDGEIFGELC